MPFRLAAVAVLALVLPIHAGDWTQFRGPTGQGLSDAAALPLEWGVTKNVAWKVDVPGKGWSSPIVLGEKVLLTSAVGEGEGSQELRVLCLDSQTGKTLWDTLVFTQTEARIHGKNSHASPTPVTDGQRVFVHFGTNGTACLDLEGKVLWRNRELEYPPVHGSGGSPVLVDGKLIVSCDGSSDPFVVALDQETGRVAWKKPRPASEGKQFAFSTPLVIEVAGQTQVVSAGANVVCAYDPTDGREIWWLRYPGPGYSVVPRPVFGHGLVFLSTGFDTPRLLAVRPDGTGDVTATHLAWTFARGAPRNASPLLVGDELYVVSDNGVMTCLEPSSGKELGQKRLGGDYSASPVHAGGRLYFQSEQGEGIVLAAGKPFKELARNPLDERTLASYAVAGERLLIRTETKLYCFE